MKAKLFALALLAAAGARAEAWMGALPDRAYIDQLSIPGTHDSCTGNGLYGAPFADSFGRTQSLTLAEQLAAGVRAFDLRPAVDTGGYITDFTMREESRRTPIGHSNDRGSRPDG